MSTELDVYTRFISRWDTWARQDQKPDKKEKFQYFRVKKPLTRKDIDESLLGRDKTIGVYTIKPGENTVVNPTVDADNHDGKTPVVEVTKKIYHAMKVAGMFPYVEASAGDLQDGANIGVICAPTQACMAKVAIKIVLDSIGMGHLEVNPKQDSVDIDGFGNLVKLPWQFNNRTGARSQIINPETWQPMGRTEAIKYMLELPETEFKGVVGSDVSPSIKVSPTEFDNNELPVNQPEDFKTLSIKERAVLVDWIRTHLTPRKSINNKHSSYGLKHFFEHDKQHGGLYVTNGAFKGAMLLCGYLPSFGEDTNWCFRISKQSKAFIEAPYGCC